MPEIKHQEMWDWAVEAYDPPGVLTVFKIRQAVKHLVNSEVNPPFLIPSGMWAVYKQEMTLLEAKAKWPNLGS
jgi:hypothetical protein